MAKNEKEQRKQNEKCHYCRFRAIPIEFTEHKQSQPLPLTVGVTAIVMHAPHFSRTGILPHDLP